MINRSSIPEIDYRYFDEIIIKNLGKDISSEISNLTMQQFASNTTMEAYST
ncbi:Type II restriction enzyme HgAI (Endonuclease HgAI) (R.HgAI) [Neisseria meningitidis serogroup B]|uniref:Type II restriction enzyme HgAI (Endonuclease HgAI) (R.HgAI) n=1 Tax=Neisseria meningitidis serogroup B TaxID=491 RepID=A0A0H5Q9R9_NEIMI|nr:Type II restriction enzyme HgAI (Endonuclease HgAI) (R.HgAI) [Neisseria meningitidis serogroup B]